MNFVGYGGVEGEMRGGSDVDVMFMYKVVRTKNNS